MLAQRSSICDSPIDPQELARLVAWLADQADDKRFGLAAQPTAWRQAVPSQAAPQLSGQAVGLAPAPGVQAWVVGYELMYRRQHFHAHLVVASAFIGIAKGLLAQDARFQLESWNQQHPWYDSPDYSTAGGKGVRAGP